ncbi:MAG: hypothetical protein ACFFDK_06665 [Promethearchaeota archaeon]
MIYNIFPINGPLKEPLLIIESFIVIFFLEIGAIFWIRAKNEDVNELKGLQEKAYGWLLIGYSIMWLFIIIGDHFVEPLYFRTLILNIGFLIQIICLTIFFKIIENNKIFWKKYLFTKICIVMTGIYLFIFIFFIYDAAFVVSAFWILLAIFTIYYLKELSSNFYIKKELGDFKLISLKFWLGLIITAFGYQLTTRTIVKFEGLELRLFGDILQLVGLIFISSFLFSVPSFTEYEWRDQIEYLSIMHKSGLFIYQKAFKNKITSAMDESVITGTLTTIKMMLEEFGDSNSISIIRKKNKTFIIEPGKFVYGVIICDKELEALKILLNKFIEKLEIIYDNILMSWDGNLKVFIPIDDIAKEFFSS